jgi:hypothetical protein
MAMMAKWATANGAASVRLKTRRHDGSEALAAARRLLERDRQQGLAAINELFRQGTPPAPAPDGSYRGELVALDVAPGLTQLAQWLAQLWLPWLGKHFYAERNQGDNLFSRDSYWLARLMWPLYRGYRPAGGGAYHAFAFRTAAGAGKADPDRQVLRIDYDLSGNPRLMVRRVLDELVQIGEGLYLGKAHLKWWWGRWQMVAFLMLAGGNGETTGEWGDAPFRRR